MLKRFRSGFDSQLDALIDDAMHSMLTMEPGTEEYSNMMKHLEKLNELKATHRPPRISRDTMLIVFGNIAVTVIIVAYEHAHVMTSRARDHHIRPELPR